MATTQVTPFQLTDQFTMDNFNERINETNTALQNKENSFSVLPLNKGGTGVNDITALRMEVGIGFAVGCDAGKSVNITLPDNGSYLICANDNVRRGAILVQAGSTFGTIKRVTVLSSPLNWSYEIGNGVLTLSETDGEWPVSFYVTSLGLHAYSGG